MSQLYPGVLSNVLLVIGLILLFTSNIGNSRQVRLLIAILFIFANIRYLTWRFDGTLPAPSFTAESIWMWVFYSTEVLAAVALSWHFFIMVSPSNRKSEADHWEKILRASSHLEAVDIFIPTVNEPIELLEKTINAALKQEYPNKKVWVLDDGNRAWLKEYCQNKSINYIARTHKKGFKAGNLNHALSLTNSPIVCVVDADFILHTNFLWRTVGFLSEPEVGLVQTPQAFYNPDAIQHNLGGNTSWPESQRTFSDIIQAGRDNWDNAFCYGTSFIVKREALDKLGGFPEESISEDLLTSYALRALGYKTRFLNEQLSLGQATQDIAEYINQRARWCIGAIQCLFVDRGLLRSRSLSLVDRLFFLDPIVYHLGTIWTLLLLIAPALYWWFGIATFHTDYGHLLVVLAPRMLLVTLGFYWLSNKKTIPIVSEIGRVVGIFHFAYAILNTFVNPFKQKFRTTIKIVKQEQTIVYWQILAPLAALGIITVLGIILRYANYLSKDLLWRSDFGLMISLTIYALWMIYLSCLTCIQRPITNTEDTVPVGSIRKSIKSIARRVFM